MFGRNSFNFQRSLSTNIKLVHTLKKSLCGFWANNFWKFIHKCNILSLLCLEETALTFKDLYQHTLNWFILKRSHFVDLKHEHWCFHSEGVYQTHDLNIHFGKKQFCVRFVTQLQISKISIRYLKNEHWYFHFLGFDQTNFGYLCREETDSWSNLRQIDSYFLRFRIINQFR